MFVKLTSKSNKQFNETLVFVSTFSSFSSSCLSACSSSTGTTIDFLIFLFVHFFLIGLENKN